MSLRAPWVARVGLYAAAILLSLWILIPIYFIGLAAFSTQDAVFTYPKQLVPKDVSLESMRFFLESAGVFEALMRSIYVAAITIVLTMAIATPAGYAVARFAFRGSDAFRLLILSTRAFPIVILSIPLAVTFLRWGIDDSVWGVSLAHTALALPFAVLVISSVFAGISVELEEAAMTLGCTRLSAFGRIILPLALPGLTAAAIFTFVISWNEVFAASILTLRNQTLPALVLASVNQAPLPFRFAGGFFLLAPSLIVIFIIRKYLFNMWGRVVR
jgi:multiple sugar transport system permease protein